MDQAPSLPQRTCFQSHPARDERSRRRSGQTSRWRSFVVGAFWTNGRSRAGKRQRTARRGRPAAPRAKRCRSASRRPRGRSTDRARSSRCDRPRRGRSARTPSRAAPAGCRARRPRPTSTTSPLRRSTVASTAVPGSVWRSAFSSRLSASRCSSSRAPSTRPRGRRDADRVVARHRLELADRLRDDLGEIERHVRAASRPASARASSSRSATSRRIRRDERSADAAASRASPSSSISSSSRLASTEVRGVRSSCEASATNSRWRASAASVSPRAWSSAWSMLSSVSASSDTSSLGLGVRDPQRRVARARDRARGLGQARDRGHGARRGGEAGEQRQRCAAEHAEPEEDAHAVGRRLGVGEPARVLDAERRWPLHRHGPRLDR